MTPSLDSLEVTASDVLRRLPEGLTRGGIAAGLYGFGFVGRAALPQLRRRGVHLVCGYDANEALHGRCIDGLTVRAPAMLQSDRPEYVVVTARHAVKTIAAVLEQLGIPHVSYDAWRAAESFAAFRDVHDRLLADERSKQVLRAVLAAMLTGEASYCESVCEKDQYFCLPSFRNGQNEHFVDAGAFDGDSADHFLRLRAGRFAKLYAFEPGTVQFAALQARAQRWVDDWGIDPARIELVNAGLGDGEQAMLLETANGQLTSLASYSAKGEKGFAAAVVSLDRYLDGRPVTFLKADVEGMERQLLRGASGAIQRHRPKLAICAYHHPTDIPAFASYIRTLVPEYRLALRHHSPQLLETVLYSWID
jgi:FkbM family methyltransferase